MRQEIDARGLDCPAPVLKTKEAIEKQGATTIKIIVDNTAAVENVSRFLTYRHYQVSVETKGKFFAVTGIREETGSVSESGLNSRSNSGSNKNKRGDNKSGPVKQAEDDHKSDSDHQKIMVMIASEQIGKGDDELGTKLMRNFIITLKEMGEDLWRLVFVNGGVKFTIDESDILPDLKELEKEGVHILVCGTCLNHFKLLEKKRVGETTNMLDIVTSIQLAEKVISL